MSLSAADVASALSAGEGYMTHVRTGCYFASFLGALSFILARFPWRRVWHTRPALVVCVPYSLVALLLTWRLILLFMVDFEVPPPPHTVSVADSLHLHATPARHWQKTYKGHADPPNLFVEAYVLVCDTKAGWWWSSLLLTWVTVACPLVASEASRRQMPSGLALAHIVTAFLGAVSLAFPILFVHLSTLEPPRTDAVGAERTATSSRLWAVCVGASLVSVAVLPSSVAGLRALFIVALLVVHVVLLVPFVRPAPAQPQRGFWGQGADRAPAHASLSAAGYALLAFLCFLLYARASVGAFLELSQPLASSATAGGAPSLGAIASALLAASARNVCQASISIDALMATAAGCAYVLGRSGTRGLLLCCAAPLISPAAALALHEALLETQRAPPRHHKRTGGGRSDQNMALTGPPRHLQRNADAVGVRRSPRHLKE